MSRILAVGAMSPRIRPDTAESSREKTFKQLEGSGSYGFQDSHASSFALIAYDCCFIKCHYPEAFAAAFINSFPTGFYAPAQIIGDAHKQGVEIRPISVQHLRWDCTLEEIPDPHRPLFGSACGMCQAWRRPMPRGSLLHASSEFQSVDDVWRRSQVPSEALVELAEADAFRPAFGLERRNALWGIKTSRDELLRLFVVAAERETKAVAEQQEPKVVLRQITEAHNVVEDYRHVCISLREHPISLPRRDLTARRIVIYADAMNARDKSWLCVPRLLLVRQKPGSAKGVMFILVEDKTGPANIVVWPSLSEKRRRVSSERR